MTIFNRKNPTISDQYQNKDWWEKNPMSYDWGKKNQFEKYSLNWFNFLDQEFYKNSKIYHKNKNNFFDEFINYSNQNRKVILEIGCGLGLHCEKIVTESNPKQYIGIDITKNAINTTRARLKLKNILFDHITLINCDAEKIPLENSSVDTVWSWGVIHHSLNTENIIKEINRVLKPNGEFKIMVYNKISIRYLILGGLINGIFKMKFLKKNLHDINMEFTDGYYAKHYSKKEIINIFKQNNLKVKKIEPLQDSNIAPIPGFLTLTKLKIFKNFSDYLMKKYGWFLYLEGCKIK